MEDANKTASSITNTDDFTVSKFYVYSGPNYYLNKKAIVFNLYITPDGPGVDFYKDRVLKKFPVLEENYPDRVAELFALIISHVNKMDLNLFIETFSVEREDEEWVIAVEYLIEIIKDTVTIEIDDDRIIRSRNVGVDDQYTKTTVHQVEFL